MLPRIPCDKLVTMLTRTIGDWNYATLTNTTTNHANAMMQPRRIKMSVTDLLAISALQLNVANIYTRITVLHKLVHHDTQTIIDY